MHGIPSLIQDLALILVTAGIVTLVFKKLKQPLVLGYIMAGFIVSPNLKFTMSVVDNANIRVWADIGVMFLLFALGLDFSFKKILKMGIAPIIAALLHDDDRHNDKQCVRLVNDERPFPRRNACHVVNNHNLQGL